MKTLHLDAALTKTSKTAHPSNKTAHPSSKTARLLREEELLIELQRDHGYMFLPATKVMERALMHCVVDKKTRKAVLTASHVARVSVPDGSWLGKEIVASIKKAETSKSKDKSRKRR